MLQQERAEQPRPLAAVVVWSDATAQQEARALPQQEQVSRPVRAPRIELGAQAALVQPQALEEQLERVQLASLPAQAAQRQVSPQPAALPGGVAAEPRPLPSSA